MPHPYLTNRNYALRMSHEDIIFVTLENCFCAFDLHLASTMMFQVYGTWLCIDLGGTLWRVVWSKKSKHAFNATKK